MPPAVPSPTLRQRQAIATTAAASAGISDRRSRRVESCWDLNVVLPVSAGRPFNAPARAVRGGASLGPIPPGHLVEVLGDFGVVCVTRSTGAERRRDLVWVQGILGGYARHRVATGADYSRRRGGCWVPAPASAPTAGHVYDWAVPEDGAIGQCWLDDDGSRWRQAPPEGAVLLSWWAGLTSTDIYGAMSSFAAPAEVAGV